MAMLPEERATLLALKEKVADLDRLVHRQSVTMHKLEKHLPGLIRTLLQLQSLNSMPIIVAQLYAELALASPQPIERLDELLFSMSGPAEAALTIPETSVIGLEIAKVHDLIRKLAEEYVIKRSTSSNPR